MTATARLRLTTPESLTTATSPDQSSSLAWQQFHGRLGQQASWYSDIPETWLGLGPHPTPGDVHRALTRASLPGEGIVEVDIAALLSVSWSRDEAISLVTSALSARGLDPRWESGDEAAASRGRVHAAATRTAQAWTNATAADLPPEQLAREAVTALDDCEVRVLGPQELADGGFGAILAVGAGSAHGPRLVDAVYRPQQAARARVCLVGKGVTFDTGGLSLKSPAAMAGMRMDKAGAAIVLSVLAAVRDLRLPIELRALAPLAENMIGPSATRPGDIATAWDGTRIRIMDTDFEGRVLMADALALGSSDSPDIIIDVATLTYQVAIGLGNDVGGFFSSDEVLSERLVNASASAGEPLWRLPLVQSYLDQVITADGVKNHPESDVGRAITAALFLQHFVRPGVAWAHLDLTGPAWRGPASADGATGFGVRTLITLMEGLAASR